MPSINIEIVEGRGSLIAKRNGSTAATVNPGDGVIVVTYNVGDTFEFTAYPDTTLGYSFNKFCGDSLCTISTTANPFTGTVTQDGYLQVYFKGTPATVQVSIAAGQGMVDVYRNTRLIGTVTTSTQTFNFFINDTFSFSATPASNNKFDKFCSDQACTYTSTSNPLTGTITQANGAILAYFKSTSPPAGCIIQSYGFSVQGSLIGTPTCTGLTSDVIGVEADVSFDAASVGKNFYFWFDILRPDGKTAQFWGNNGNSYLINSAGIYTFSQDNIISPSDPTGVYKINSVYVLASDKVSFVCSATNSAYGCTQITLTSPPPPVNQWNINIYIKDSVTNSPLSGATVTIATQTKTTDANGYVQFRVNEGTITISMSKTGYNTLTAYVAVFADKTFAYWMSPITSTGSISFVSVPTGAEIFIDNIDQNTKTNNSVVNVPAGTHTFTLKLAGYNDFAGTVTVQGGSTSNVSAVLTPTTTGTGSLYITSTPSGADVILDGSPQNVTTPVNIPNLTAGSHSVKLTKTGYQDYTTTVVISAGMTTNISATLNLMSGSGILDISSNPPGAKIYIDGSDTQKVTPATITNLAAGDHTFKITLSGYNDEIGTFTIVPGNTTQAAVTMTKSGINPDVAIGVTVIAIGAAGLYLAIKEGKHQSKINGG